MREGIYLDVGERIAGPNFVAPIGLRGATPLENNNVAGGDAA